MAGELRLVEWMTAPLIGPVAHAWLASGPQSRSLCDLVPWRPTLVPVAAPCEPCRVCREVVAGAAFRALEEIAELEGGPAPITRAVTA